MAINKYYILYQWKEFQSNFVLIYELHQFFLLNVVFFGYSIIIDTKIEQVIKKYSGFQLEGTKLGILEIIRTSIDQLDISIYMFPIPKGKINYYKQLYFLLNQVVKSSNSGLTPQKILKIIVFLNNKKHIVVVS